LGAKTVDEPGTENKNEFSSQKKSVLEVVSYFKTYFKNPVLAIKSAPNWSWTVLITVSAVFSVSTGLISGAFSGRVTSILGNIFTYPIVNISSLFITAGFFFFLIQFLYKLNLDFQKVFCITLLAGIPAMILRVFSPFDIPVGIIGVLAACFLLAVGFIENFFVPKKGILKIMGAFFSIFLIFWVYSVISISHEKEAAKPNVTRESLDILQKELTGK